MKIIKLNRPKLLIRAFKLWFFTYGKINDSYQIEVNIFDVGLTLYKSEKKPWFRNLLILNLVLGLAAILAHIIVFIFWFFQMYVDGARNFIKDGAWVQNVREFNWINIIALIISIIIHFLR